ncbi:CBS domain-containing protein [Oceanisphaera arctica]|uniref:CBS domain-containing protein n=1 Tax=Oceanisphaera arctica TaxID=641510 RepID=A0A2P5TQA0_9GAMM|nr:CBS domain-containing protein [Oceanisphaera arctica]PPL17888.1 CBS domain-containing protein [Oceanisphaera arctica]GHA23830.1 CBS domain-containing protein [Oceanisphaera arctica]
MAATTVGDIMARDLLTLDASSTLKDAHDLMREKSIRHIPVVDKLTGKLLGVLTQKRMIATVMSLLSDYGVSALERRERQCRVVEIIDPDVESVDVKAPLTEVVPFFLKNRHGCLTVVDSEQCLTGIVTSSDFVRLCAELLKERNA